MPILTYFQVIRADNRTRRAPGLLFPTCRPHKPATGDVGSWLPLGCVPGMCEPGPEVSGTLEMTSSVAETFSLKRNLLHTHVHKCLPFVHTSGL